MKRRAVCALAATFCSCLLILGLSVFPGVPGRADAASDEVVFAAVDDFSGPYASTGDELLKGWEVAFEEVNYKVLGKKIKFIKRDTQLKPAVGVRKFREVVEQEHPVLVGSGCSSAVQLAMEEVAGGTRTLFETGGWSSEITAKGFVNRYTFRWPSSNYAIAHSSVDGFMKLFPKDKKFYFITMDYAWGHDMAKEATAVIEKNGGKVIGNVLTPMNETDYSTAITKALAAKPDVIMLNQYGAPLIKSARAVHEFGAKKRAKILIPGDGLDMLRGIGSDALEGMYVGNHWYHTVDTDFTRKFVEKFQAKYKAIPSYYAILHYTMAKLTIQAIERAKSTDPNKIIKQLEGYKYDGPTGKEEIRAFDHQVIHPYFLSVGKSPKEKKYDDDYLKVLSSAMVYPTYAQNPVVWDLKLPGDKKPPSK